MRSEAGARTRSLRQAWAANTSTIRHHLMYALEGWTATIPWQGMDRAIAVIYDDDSIAVINIVEKYAKTIINQKEIDAVIGLANESKQVTRWRVERYDEPTRR